MKRNWPVWVLIAAFVLVMGWFGIDKFRNPVIWVGFLPTWMDGLLGMDKNMWLQIIGAGEITMAILLLIPHWLLRQLGAAMIIAHLAAILMQVGVNNDIGIRDSGLLLAAVALLLLLREERAKSAS